MLVHLLHYDDYLDCMRKVYTNSQLTHEQIRYTCTNKIKRAAYPHTYACDPARIHSKCQFGCDSSVDSVRRSAGNVYLQHGRPSEVHTEKKRKYWALISNRMCHNPMDLEKYVSTKLETANIQRTKSLFTYLILIEFISIFSINVLWMQLHAHTIHTFECAIKI